MDNDLLKCRLCLENAEDMEMFDLFSDTEDSEKLQPFEKVEYCCGVRIRQSLEMPSKICLKCFDMTRIWFNFRQMCVNSQVYLESMCKDRIRPIEFDEDESAYLDYLLQDLQTIRGDIMSKKENALAFSTESSDDDEGNHFEDILMVEPELEPEFENIIHNEVTENSGYSGDEITGGNDDDEDYGELSAKQPRKQTKIITTQRRKPTATTTSDTQKKIKPLLKKELRPPSPNSYMCSVCGNVYNKKASFTNHMITHSDVKPHECEICGKAFRQVCELKNHMRRHTGEKPFKCSYCERRFIDRSEKHRHERVHTNSRPYVCTVCGKSFAYSTILKNHSKLHSGEKDYNCLVCEKSFSLQHQLKAHLQTITHKQRETQFVSAGFEVVYE